MNLPTLTHSVTLRHTEGQDMEQEGQPKHRKVGHLYPDVRNVWLLARHKSPSPVEGPVWCGL